MKFQRIAADTLQPETIVTFDELSQSVRDIVVMREIGYRLYEVGETAHDWTFEHFTNSDIEPFACIDERGDLNCGIYGTFDVQDLLNDACIYFVTAKPGSRVTIPCPTIDSHGRVHRDWRDMWLDNEYANQLADQLETVAGIDSEEFRSIAWVRHSWQCACQIIDSMRSWQNELERCICEDYENDLYQHDDLWTESGDWIEYYDYDYRMQIEDPDADVIEACGNIADVIKYHCKNLETRERLNLESIESCTRKDFNADHEVWVVKSTDGTTCAYDLITGLVVG